MITQKIIKHLLDNHLTTKVVLAYDMGVTPYTITNWLNGRNEMSPTKLLNLCKTYGLDINDFQDDD